MKTRIKVTAATVEEGGQVTDVCSDDLVTSVELWLPSSEKRQLEKRIEELENELRGQVHWKTEYLLLRDRLENPHLYDDKGCPTPEALEGPKGGPIYGSPSLAPEERRRVVTIRERILELGSAFYHRGNDKRLSSGQRSAWKRAYVDLMVLRHHGMDRPDLPICLKCGGTGDVFPTELEWVETNERNRHATIHGGRPMIQKCKPCGCQDGFNPDGDIDEIIDH